MSENSAPACSNGHPVEVGQSFCPVCGVLLVASASPTAKTLVTWTVTPARVAEMALSAIKILGGFTMLFAVMAAFSALSEADVRGGSKAAQFFGSLVGFCLGSIALAAGLVVTLRSHKSN